MSWGAAPPGILSSRGALNEGRLNLGPHPSPLQRGPAQSVCVALWGVVLRLGGNLAKASSGEAPGPPWLLKAPDFALLAA